MPESKPDLWGPTETYERYMGRWSRKVAPLFLKWINVPRASEWIDIGSGTGELAAAIVETCAPARLAGIDTSPEYVAFAGKRLPGATFKVGSALELPAPDNSADAAVSGLVLNFVPDQPKAISEMVRAVRPQGIVAAYVWDYAGHMQIMRYFFDTASRFDNGGSQYDDGLRAPICRPGPLGEAFRAAGLAEVETIAIDIATPFADFEDYWAPFTAGTGSAPKYCASLDGKTRNRIRDALRARLPTGPDGEILLAARAWAVRGRVAN